MSNMVTKDELDYVINLMTEFLDRDTFCLLKARLLKNKYGTYFDERVSVDDVGIIIAGSSGFESDFEESLNLIEKAYRKTLDDDELDKLCAEWLEYRIPAKVLWGKLGVKLETARLWRYELEIPIDELEKIADKLGVPTSKIMGKQQKEIYL